MKTKLVALTLALLAFAGSVTVAAPLGTAFTYQGRLDQNGQPANGAFLMRFALYDAPAPGGNLVNGTNLLTVGATNGLFTADLDFGASAFAGEARWLDIAVSTNNAITFDTLLPRTRIAPTPNALYASTAGTVTNGAIKLGQLGTLGPPPGPNQVLGYDGSSLVWQPPGGVSSVWTLNGTSAYYNGGNVGIGTATPTVPLHVNSSATGSSVLAALLEPSLGSGGFNQVYLGRSPVGNGSGTFTYTYNAASPSSSFLSLGLYDSSYTLNVRGNGYVGIGTTAPTAPLHVNSSATGSSVLAALLEPGLGGGAFNQLFLGRSPVGNGCGTFTYTYNAANPQASLLSLGLYDSSYSLNLSGNGNVGIGVTTPINKLEVVGAASQTAVLGYSSGSIGVFGRSTTSTGVHGETASAAAAGVVGVNLNTSFGQGVFGESLGAGVGVWGKSASFEGVHGETTSPTFAAISGINLGAGPGVYGRSDGGGYGGFFIGKVRVGILEIAGGADLAEPFPMKEQEIEKGSVVDDRR